MRPPLPTLKGLSHLRSYHRLITLGPSTKLLPRIRGTPGAQLKSNDYEILRENWQLIHRHILTLFPAIHPLGSDCTLESWHKTNACAKNVQALHVLIPKNSQGIKKSGQVSTVLWLGNLPLIHLEFEELELDKRELDKQEVEQPEVDRFDLDEPGVGMSTTASNTTFLNRFDRSRSGRLIFLIKELRKRFRGWKCSNSLWQQLSSRHYRMYQVDATQKIHDVDI
ncbi:hypothetical protein Tco_1459427, partial [Tanacetum coccineum]